MEALAKLLNHDKPVADKLLAFFLAKVIRVAVKRRDLLLEIGQVSNKVFFIEQGLFRGYVLDKGNDNSIWFMKEGDLMFGVNSFYTQMPSKEGIEAIEDGVVHSLSYTELMWAYDNFLEFNFNGRKLTEHYYMKTWPDMERLRKVTATERLHHFEKTHPDLLNRVSSTHMASFLGITPETLSRIRRKK